MSSNKPFPSSDLDVFKENSLILDNFVNSQENEYPDRFARKRPTITGIIKEAFNVRTDISNMNETLIGQSRWDAVPKNTSLSLGGDNGALNKQAQALFNRTVMLKAHAREALRRTYLEAGLNLVDGSFEQGGVLNNQNDVLLQERTGKVFSGPAGTVPAGTNPASGGFVDRSNAISVRCLDVSELKLIDPSTGPQRAYLSSVNTGAEGGSGYMIFDSASTDTEYQGVVIKPPMLSTGRWKREAKENLSLYHFGAYGDGTHDDTQAAIDYLNWQKNTGKAGASIGSGTFLITGTLPFPTYGAFCGNGDDSIISVGMTDTGVLFNIPAGQYAYSWLIEKMKFMCASGGSLRAQILNVAGSLRGAAIRDVSSWEFSRPFSAKGNIWGNLILDGVNAYRISNPLLTGDTPFDLDGNTLMMQNIEAIGAFDKIIKYTGRVFKLDGFNTGGASSGRQSAGAIYLENAVSGYIRAGWIEQVDANIVSNGEGEAVYAKNCTSITIEDINISTGSVWVDGGSKINVRNIAYAQANGGLRVMNGAKVNVSKSGLGKYNTSTDLAKRTYAEPLVVDGNNCGRGLVANPTNPFAVMAPSNGAIATMTQDTTNFISGTSSAKFTTFNNTAGGRLTIPCIPNKEYTVCLTAKALTAGISLTLDRDPATATTALTDEHIYVSKTTGVDAAANWVKLNRPVKSTTATLDVIITCAPHSEFVVDAIDVYAGVSTFNPSQLG